MEVVSSELLRAHAPELVTAVHFSSSQSHLVRATDAGRRHNKRDLNQQLVDECSVCFEELILESTHKRKGATDA